MTSITTETATIDNGHRLYLANASALNPRLHPTQRHKPLVQTSLSAGTSTSEFAPLSTTRSKQNTRTFGNLRGRNQKDTRSGSLTPTSRSGSTTSNDADPPPISAVSRHKFFPVISPCAIIGHRGYVPSVSCSTDIIFHEVFSTVVTQSTWPAASLIAHVFHMLMID